ncbi:MULTISPECIES: hypothetical protein [Mycobacteriaceae]|uniref:hypothetical protein n=1 Tax=Mycobacteriaceae TaxID=1762 RepID=UPI00096CA76E|nr:MULTISPECIES: hypothetical protein [Mycobacteriaceae]SKK26007.1 Uncharacterised protein [Mycobacteroides abscessus subsp. massiliense]
MKHLPRTYIELIAAVWRDFGIDLAVRDAGDGCGVLRGRLETGHWVVISDCDGFLAEVEYVLDIEASGYSAGWFVGIYANDDSSGMDRPARHAEGGCIAYAQQDEARFHELKTVIQEALHWFGVHRNEQQKAVSGRSCICDSRL